jgi:hypothetical protein
MNDKIKQINYIKLRFETKYTINNILEITDVDYI